MVSVHLHAQSSPSSFLKSNLQRPQNQSLSCCFRRRIKSKKKKKKSIQKTPKTNKRTNKKCILCFLVTEHLRKAGREIQGDKSLIVGICGHSCVQRGELQCASIKVVRD